MWNGCRWPMEAGKEAREHPARTFFSSGLALLAGVMLFQSLLDCFFMNDFDSSIRKRMHVFFLS